MKNFIDGKAIVYADGAFNTPNGKTAHGLVRFTERYDVAGVIDRTYARKDAGEVLDGRKNGIVIFADLSSAVQGLGLEQEKGTLVIGLAPDGGEDTDPATQADYRPMPKRSYGPLCSGG